MIDYWKLTTGVNGNGKPPGMMKKIAAFLYKNKKVDDVFTAAELRHAIVNNINNENLTRRLRELREIGWVFDTYKSNPLEKINSYRIIKIGWHPFSENPILKNKDISQKLRRKIFERDGLRCRICGIGVNENYLNESVTARLTLGHIISKSNGGSNDIENLQTECARCNEPFGNNTSYLGIDDIQPFIDLLSPKEKFVLKTWLEQGYREISNLDYTFSIAKKLNTSDFSIIMKKLLYDTN